MRKNLTLFVLAVSFWMTARAEPLKVLTPSKVHLSGNQLLVSQNGSPAKPYLIKGVCWSPSSLGTPGDPWARIAEYKKWYRQDFDMMAGAHINTIYTFFDFGINDDAVEILNYALEKGIMVIPTVDFDGTNDMSRLEAVVSKYKTHPAILAWAIGNEWNINLYHGRAKSLLEAAKATEKAAKKIKQLDKFHPVASIFGEIIIPKQEVSTREIVGVIAPSVDLWGLNIYRGGTFGKVFEDWRAVSSKPFFFSEFGTDSYYSTKWWPVEGREDEAMQAEFIGNLFAEIKTRCRTNNPRSNCVGGTVFEWNDELWKVKESDGGSKERQDGGGFPTTWNKYSHPDSFANEEYFGLVKVDRTPKKVLDKLRQVLE